MNDCDACFKGEIYTPERIVEFLLNNSLGEEEYRWAVEEALRLGVDPSKLVHIFRDEPWQNPSLYMNERVQISS